MLFIIGVPFIDSPYFMMLHVIFIPFLLLHWVTNNDTCVLTLIEKYMRGIKTKDDEDECFTCRIINPMFNFNLTNKDISKYLYTVVISLWIISVLRLTTKFKDGDIKNWRDLFVIKNKLH
jgi:hypothetical protein